LTTLRVLWGVNVVVVVVVVVVVAVAVAVAVVVPVVQGLFELVSHEVCFLTILLFKLVLVRLSPPWFDLLT